MLGGLKPEVNPRHASVPLPPSSPHLYHPGLLVGGGEGEGEFVCWGPCDDQQVAPIFPPGVTAASDVHLRPHHLPSAHAPALALLREGWHAVEVA